MSKKQIEECIRENLEGYFKDLRGVEPAAMYDMILRVVEKPLLEVVMKHAEGNQSGRRMAGHQPQHAAAQAARPQAQVIK
jgi:DNA-binding protein Fis